MLDALVRDGESTHNNNVRVRVLSCSRSSVRAASVSCRCRSKQCLTKQSTAIAHAQLAVGPRLALPRPLLASYTANRQSGDVLSKHNRERKWLEAQGK